jgi:hypothetical protein
MLTFPFGDPITPVRQADKTPKRVFVLGVYASAVHARWVADGGRTIINALAVAAGPSPTGGAAGQSFGHVERLASVLDWPRGAWHLAPLLDWLMHDKGYPVPADRPQLAQATMKVNTAVDSLRTDDATRDEIRALSG